VAAVYFTWYTAAISYAPCKVHGSPEPRGVQDAIYYKPCWVRGMNPKE
jgi:hypothetical protein